LILGIAALASVLLFMNSSSSTVVQGDAPDLVITDLFFTDGTCYDGGYMDTPVNATVENRGDADANSTDVEFFLMPAGISLGSHTVGEIQAGESRNITFRWDSNGLLGDRMIRAVVDHGDAVNESDESNNNATVETGHWEVITGDGPAVEYSDRTIVITGNLTVAGELTLRGCDLLINSTPGGDDEPFGITVGEYSVFKGDLHAEDTLIAAAGSGAAPFRFKVQRYCSMTLQRVTVTDIYWNPESSTGGMDIASDKVEIHNSTIAAGGKYGIRTRADMTVANSTIRDSGFSAYDVVQGGNYAYTSSPYSGITVVDVSAPFSPEEKGRFRLARAIGGYGAPGLSGDILVVPAGRAGVQIVNVSDPGSPWLTGELAFPGTEIRDISLFGGHYCAAVSSDGIFYVINLSDPSGPVIEGELRLDAVLEHVDAVWEKDSGGPVACAAGAGVVYFINTSDPGDPGLVSNLTLDRTNLSKHNLTRQDNVTGGVIVHDDFVFASFGSQLFTINISNLSGPAVQWTTGVPAEILGIHLAGERVTAACGPLGIIVYEIRQHGELAGYTRYDTPGRSAFAFYNYSLSIAYVADSEGGLRLVHIREPGLLTNFTYEIGALERKGTGLTIVHGAFMNIRDSFLSDHLLFSSRGNNTGMSAYSTTLEGHTAAELESGNHLFSGCGINTHTQGILASEGAGGEGAILYLEDISFTGVRGTAVSQTGGSLHVEGMHIHGSARGNTSNETGMEGTSTGIELRDGASAVIENYSARLDRNLSYAGRFYDSFADLSGIDISDAYRGILFSSGSGLHTLNITAMNATQTGIALFLRGGAVTVEKSGFRESDTAVDAEDAVLTCRDAFFRDNRIAFRVENSDMSLHNAGIENSSRGIETEGGTLWCTFTSISSIGTSTALMAGNSTIHMENSSLQGHVIADIRGDTYARFLDVVQDGEINAGDDALLEAENILDLHVIDRLGQNFGGVNITIKDIDGSTVFAGSTGSGGERNGIVLQRAYYDRNGETTRTPHRVNLSYADQSDEFSVDIDSHLDLTRTFVIYEDPVAILNVSRTYAPTNYDDIRFDASGSFDPDGDISWFYFEFGDGRTRKSRSSTTSHGYDEGDIYTARLRVEDNDGRLGEWVSVEITINDPPLATISESGPIKVTSEESFDLDGSISQDPNENHPSQDYITAYEWDMGNGDIFTTSMVENYTYHVVKKTEYEVRLRVWDSFGEHNDVYITVKVDPNIEPYASIGVGETNYTYRDEGHFINFNGADSSDPNGKELYYLWDFDDGVTMSGAGEEFEDVGHRFVDPGVYNVTLTVTDPGGLSDIANITINIILTSGDLSMNRTVLETSTRNIFFEFMVVNTGSHRERFSVDFLMPGNWYVSGGSSKELSKIYLDAGEERTFNRTLGIPTLDAGDYGFTMELYSHRDDDMELQDSIGLVVRVLPYYRVTVSVSPSAKEIGSGGSTEFTVKVANRGNTPDRFELELEDIPAGWIATYDGENIPYRTGIIDIGEETEINLFIQAPGDSAEGAYQMRVKVTSLNDGEESASSTVRVTITPGESQSSASDDGTSPFVIAGGVVLLVVVVLILKSRGGKAGTETTGAQRRTVDAGVKSKAVSTRKEPEKVKVVKKKDTREIPCPRCGESIPISSDTRPLRIKCPGCGATGTIR